MAAVDPTKCNIFHVSFCSALGDIVKGISTCTSAAADEYLKKWAKLCRGAYLDLLPIS